MDRKAGFGLPVVDVPGGGLPRDPPPGVRSGAGHLIDLVARGLHHDGFGAPGVKGQRTFPGLQARIADPGAGGRLRWIRPLHQSHVR